MSVSKVKSALVDFVKGEKDRAIVLKGDWGTGKTYLWKQVVLESRDLFHKRNYSYVSLFGLNSLKDLKKSIYENKVYRERAHIASDESSFEDNLKDISGRFAGWMRKGSSLFSSSALLIRWSVSMISSGKIQGYTTEKY
jgi:Cdc6-like AAA superfamily ATPase